MYGIVSTIGYLIRTFALPNPFESINLVIYNIPIYSWMISAIVEFPLYKISFWVTGLYYEKNSCPVFGSILYAFFYAVHNGLIFLASCLGFKWYWCLAILLLYIGFHYLILKFIDMATGHRYS